MTGVNSTYHIPPEEAMREVAKRLFEEETGLKIDVKSWLYNYLPESSVAVARFALLKGQSTIFNDVRVFGKYESDNSCKMHVRASINGLPPTVREFFVLKECERLNYSYAS